MMDAKAANRLSNQGQEFIDSKLVKKYLETLESAVRSASSAGRTECSIRY